MLPDTNSFKQASHMNMEHKEINKAKLCHQLTRGRPSHYILQLKGSVENAIIMFDNLKRSKVNEAFLLSSKLS